MSSVVLKKNKWENQYVKKKFRRKGLDSSGRYYVKATKHSNSQNLKGHPGRRWTVARDKRVSNMIDSKALCNNLTKNYYDINDCNGNINFSVKYNIIQIWVCNICTYRNIERKSLCAMCFSSYSSNNATVMDENKDETKSGTITLGEFCKDILDEIDIDIPVWVCGLCTYCNVEQLPQCQMCQNSYYSSNNQTTEFYCDENVEEIYAEYASNQEQLHDISDDEIYLSDDIERNVIDHNHVNVTKKPKGQQIYVTVTMKLTENKLYPEPLPMKYLIKNGDVVRYTLLECQLNVSANDECIQSYSCIPSTKDCDQYSSNDSVIVPIEYKYRNLFGEFVGYPTNFPLKTVGEFIWKSRYPSLDTIESPKWNISYPDNKYIRSPAEKREIFDVILQFIPLRDIINSILFQYLGYNEISIVKIWTTFLGYKNSFKKCSIGSDRCGFTLGDTPYSTIRSRKINSDLKLIEIVKSYEYQKKTEQIRYNGYHGYNYSHKKPQLSDHMHCKLAQFGKQPQPNDHRRKLRHKKRKLYGAATGPVLRYHNERPYYSRIRRKSESQLKGRKNRRKQKARIESNVSKQVYLYKKWPIEVGYNRMNDIFDKRYSEKDKRYVQRKWSAYWKLVVE